MRGIITSMLLICSPAFAEDVTLTAEIWGDNWFEVYIDGEKVIEDSVPITTERSFNAETATFEASAPAQVAIIAKDFKENDTGLEYIGTKRQQMGDGGLIIQIKDASGKMRAASDASARCLVVHRAPADPSCADEAHPVAGEGACAFEASDEPDGWMLSGFDDSAWPAAVEHSEAAVSPKFGYDEISWDPSARLIWSESLTQDNTLLCRVSLQ